MSYSPTPSSQGPVCFVAPENCNETLIGYIGCSKCHKGGGYCKTHKAQALAHEKTCPGITQAVTDSASREESIPRKMFKHLAKLLQELSGYNFADENIDNASDETVDDLLRFFFTPDDRQVFMENQWNTSLMRQVRQLCHTSAAIKDEFWQYLKEKDKLHHPTGEDYEAIEGHLPIVIIFIRQMIALLKSQGSQPIDLTKDDNNQVIDNLYDLSKSLFTVAITKEPDTSQWPNQFEVQVSSSHVTVANSSFISIDPSLQATYLAIGNFNYQLEKEARESWSLWKWSKTHAKPLSALGGISVGALVEFLGSEIISNKEYKVAKQAIMHPSQRQLYQAEMKDPGLIIGALIAGGLMFLILMFILRWAEKCGCLVKAYQRFSGGSRTETEAANEATPLIAASSPSLQQVHSMQPYHPIYVPRSQAIIRPGCWQTMRAYLHCGCLSGACHCRRNNPSRSRSSSGSSHSSSTSAVSFTAQQLADARAQGRPSQPVSAAASPAKPVTQGGSVAVTVMSSGAGGVVSPSSSLSHIAAALLTDTEEDAESIAERIINSDEKLQPQEKTQLIAELKGASVDSTIASPAKAKDTKIKTFCRAVFARNETKYQGLAIKIFVHLPSLPEENSQIPEVRKVQDLINFCYPHQTELTEHFQAQWTAIYPTLNATPDADAIRAALEKFKREVNQHLSSKLITTGLQAMIDKENMHLHMLEED